MIALEGTIAKHEPSAGKRSGVDMEAVVGYILLVGVLLSMALIAAGVTWHWLSTGHPGVSYVISGMNLFGFVIADLRHAYAGAVGPHLLVNLGIAVLMLTPYVRVFASMLYFAIVARNLKYTVFTAFVFSVLSYSLFLR